MKKYKGCGTCKYSKPDRNGNCDWKGNPKDWVCTNSNSDYYSDYTLYSDTCEEWEAKEK